MEDRNKIDCNEWYRCEPAAEEQVTDVFEEAGLYRIKSREELYALNQPKKRSKGGLIIGIVCAVLLVAAIIGSALVFGEEEKDPVGSAKDFFDAYSEFYDQYTEQQEEPAGEYKMPRADLNPDLELQLEDTAGLAELSLQELYKRCLPTIVGITAKKNATSYGWGTGVVMTSDGYIITNAHIVDGCTAAEVVLSDGRTFEAELVGADAISDIALLKIEAKGLTAAHFADSELVQVGDKAIAIGNPLGEEFSGSMSEGIISGLSRNVDYMNRSMTLLQTDAALNNGNSGGALFNIYGQVVGITNMKMMGSYTSSIEGVGFAIPTATVKEMVDAILDDGAVVGRPGLGITVYDLSDLGDLNEVMDDEYDYPTDGMLVNSVVKGSDAEKQGLQTDDIIIEIEGKKAEDIDVIRNAINRKQVGDTVDVTVWRAGETVKMKIKLIDQNDF